MAFRFVHSADIHLDSPLRSLALRDPALADLVGNATREAFTGMVRMCLDERVDALLLAGDLYDGEQTSMKTARFLAGQIRLLDEAGIRVFIIRGNHDALSKITREFSYPDSVKVFRGHAEAVTLGGAQPIVIHGLSFAQPSAPESLLPKYRPPVAGAVNIGLMHTSLDGSPGHDVYAPCRLADLQRSGFRYWALGHIHRRAVHEGACAVVMPGMPQGRDINEAGAKSASLVTVHDDGRIEIEERLTHIARFERVTADLGGIEDWRAIPAALQAALEGARGAGHAIARLRLTGATALHWRVRRDADLVREQAAEVASVMGRTWIEGLEVAVTAPVVGAPVVGAPVVGASVGEGGPIAELRRLIDADILPGEAFTGDITSIASTLRGQLPPECRAMFGTEEADFTAAIAALAREGVEEVLARLLAGAAGEA